MKTKFTFEPLSEEQFRTRVQNNSAQTFLTMISIIQGVAFYFLLNNAFPLFHTGVLKQHREFLVYPFLSFLSIVTVFFLYSWFVSITYRPPDLREAAIPFLVGLTQILPMFCFDEPKHWFGFFVLFLVASIIALHNTLRGLHERDFGIGFEAAYRKSCHEEHRNIWVCTVLILISLTAWWLYPDGALAFSWHDWVPVSLIVASTAYLGWKSQVLYLNPLYRIYHLSVPIEQSLKAPQSPPNSSPEPTAPGAGSSSPNITSKGKNE